MLGRLFNGSSSLSDEQKAILRRQDAALKKLSRKTGIPPDKLLDYKALNGILNR